MLRKFSFTNLIISPISTFTFLVDLFLGFMLINFSWSYIALVVLIVSASKLKKSVDESLLFSMLILLLNLNSG